MKRKGKTIEVACTLACTTTAANEKKCSMRRQFKRLQTEIDCLSVCHVPLFWEKHRAGEKAEKDLSGKHFLSSLVQTRSQDFLFQFFLLSTLQQQHAHCKLN